MLLERALAIAGVMIPSVVLAQTGVVRGTVLD
jgi:hypothetical protein